MLSPAKLFWLLNELIFVLLGLLLVWVAVTSRYLFLHRRSAAWIGLGVFLIYWGLRAWRRASRAPHGSSRGEGIASGVRGASLALVGAMMLGVAWLPFSWVGPLLGAAGGILAVRGLVSAVLAARMP